MNGFRRFRVDFSICQWLSQNLHSENKFFPVDNVRMHAFRLAISLILSLKLLSFTFSTKVLKGLPTDFKIGT
jgi:hypothetical protein